MMTWKDYQSLSSNAFPEYQEELKYRRSGRTTGLIFEALSNCYKNPGKWILVEDHTEHMRVSILEVLVIDYLKKLKFDYFQIQRTGNTIEIRLQPLKERGNREETNKTKIKSWMGVE